MVVDTAPTSVDRLERALEALGVAEAATVRDHFRDNPDAKWDWCEGRLDYYVDLLGRVHSFCFADLIADAMLVMEDELVLYVISREKLLITKRALVDAQRKAKGEQDREDLAFLMGRS